MTDFLLDDSLDYEPPEATGVSERVINFGVDSLFTGLLWLLFGGVLDAGWGDLIRLDWEAWLKFGVFYFLYHLITEALWHKSLGKMVTKTQVYGTRGEVRAGQIVVRNIVRLIPLSFLFLAILPGRQTLHDLASQTVVAEDKSVH